MNDIVIVGAGHAGGSVAINLRLLGFQGRIVLLGEEPHAPYQRPPLSKQVLLADQATTGLALKSPAWYAERDIEIRTSRRVSEIEPDARRLVFDSAESIRYGALVLATGARARALPGATDGIGNLFTLRSLDDALRLRAELTVAKHLVVIGGGYIGLEVAAVATSMATAVTVIEQESRLLARVASAPIATFLHEFHAGRGVRVVTDARVEALDTLNDRLVGVRLDGGRHIACDAVLVGIGAIPNDELASNAGIACQRGILVDEEGRTSHPDIFAVGDVTCRPSAFFPGKHRIESVPSALEQARRVAAVLAGTPLPAPELPWFWSDQSGIKLQIAGLLTDADRIETAEGVSQAGFVVRHFRAGNLRAIEAVNSPGEFLAARRTIIKAPYASR